MVVVLCLCVVLGVSRAVCLLVMKLLAGAHGGSLITTRSEGVFAEYLGTCSRYKCIRFMVLGLSARRQLNVNQLVGD